MADKTIIFHTLSNRNFRNYTHNLINKHQLLRYSFIITLSPEYILRYNSPQIISKFLCIQNFIKTFASNHRIIFIPSPSQTQMENHSFCKNFSSANPPREIKWRVETKRSADFRSSCSLFHPETFRESDPSARQFPPPLPLPHSLLPPQRRKNSGWTARSKEEKMRSRIITRSHITDEQRSGPRNAISRFEYKRATDSLGWEDIDHRWIIDEEDDNERHTYPSIFNFDL